MSFNHLFFSTIFSGGVRKGMFGELPAGILSKTGYLGCLAGLELGGPEGVAPHPLEDAVVPSTEVTRGCQGEQRSGNKC